MSWPVVGDQSTFRRRMAMQLVAAAALTLLGLCVATICDPALLRPLLPLAASTMLLALLWAHGLARAAARRREIERSFAGLRVLHHGQSYEVSSTPFLGAFASRRDAARAALDRGSWAVIVQAWDRWYLLAAEPSSNALRSRRPVSFRSRAVADVVPAIRVGA